jgi:hypothetical protein
MVAIVVAARITGRVSVFTDDTSIEWTVPPLKLSRL